MRLYHYKLEHHGYGGGFTASPVIAEWLLLLGYVAVIGFLIFRDIAQMQTSMTILFWGGLIIVLVNIAVRKIYNS